MRPALRQILLGGGYSAEATALFAQMSAIPTGARRRLIDATIRALKSSGVWVKLDLLYVTAAADSQAAGLNWIKPSANALTVTNSPTFAADRGYTGNGSNARLQTGYIPSSNGVNFTQNSASVWLWSRTAGQASPRDIGNNSVNPLAGFNCRNTSDLFLYSVNDTSATTVSNTDGSGMLGAQRISSTTTQAFRNGVQLGSNQTVSSTGLPTQEAWFVAADATAFSSRQQSMAAWGASLPGLESAFYNAMLPYMQGVGVV